MRQWVEDIGTPDLVQLLEKFGRSLSSRFNCHRVGKITAFDSETLTCSVKLLDKLVFNNTEQDYVELQDMPLLIYATDTAGLTLGDVTGSECTVHFNDTDTDNWLFTGEAYAPNSLRQHDFADGFVELRPYNHIAAGNANYDMQATTLRNGNCKIRLLNDGTIEITNGSAVVTMNGEDVAITGNLNVSGTITATTDVVTNNISLKTHTHGGVTTGGGSTGVPQ